MKRKIKSAIKSILPPSLLMPIKILLARERRLNSIEKNLQRFLSLSYNSDIKDQKTKKEDSKKKYIRGNLSIK